MHLQVPYGNQLMEFEIEEERLNGVVMPRDHAAVPNEDEALLKAVRSPVGSKPLSRLVKSGDRVVIVINDITRPTPTRAMVSVLLRELKSTGIGPEGITLVVATGSHRPSSNEELIEMLGKDLFAAVKVENHYCNRPETLVTIGKTSTGLPIEINRTVARADFIITTGVIIPHHTAGFSGGRKSILPGVSGLNTLRLHHSLPIRPYFPAMGELERNRFHQESVEAARMAGVGFILNVVQDRQKRTVAAVAGELEKAHSAGVAICRKIWEVPVPAEPDVIVASPGGYPKDIDLYQAQKAVSTAELIVKEGGVIILVAECRKGIGDGSFSRWLKEARCPSEVVKRFEREGFSVGSNKAFMFARALLRSKIIVVSHRLDPAELGEMFMHTAGSITEALGLADSMLGYPGSVLVLPNATGLIPRPEGS